MQKCIFLIAYRKSFWPGWGWGQAITLKNQPPNRVQTVGHTVTVTSHSHNNLISILLFNFPYSPLFAFEIFVHIYFQCFSKKKNSTVLPTGYSSTSMAMRNEISHSLFYFHTLIRFISLEIVIWFLFFVRLWLFRFCFGLCVCVCNFVVVSPFWYVRSALCTQNLKCLPVTNNLRLIQIIKMKDETRTKIPKGTFAYKHKRSLEIPFIVWHVMFTTTQKSG